MSVTPYDAGTETATVTGQYDTDATAVPTATESHDTGTVSARVTGSYGTGKKAPLNTGCEHTETDVCEYYPVTKLVEYHIGDLNQIEGKCIKNNSTTEEQTQPNTSHHIKILHDIGKGGFGSIKYGNLITFNDYGKKNTKPIAIKIIPKQKFNPIEYIALKRIHSHCNDGIICYITYFCDDNDIILISDYVDGSDLRKLLWPTDKGIINNDEILDNFLPQILQILDHIHTAKIVHRDIKPENIMRTKEGKYILVDFGISCDLEPESQKCDTSARTHRYIYHIPQRTIDDEEIRRVNPDIYALAVTMWELSTRKKWERPTSNVMSYPEVASIKNSILKYIYKIIIDDTVKLYGEYAAKRDSRDKYVTAKDLTVILHKLKYIYDEEIKELKKEELVDEYNYIAFIDDELNNLRKNPSKDNLLKYKLNTITGKELKKLKESSDDIMKHVKIYLLRAGLKNIPIEINYDIIDSALLKSNAMEAYANTSSLNGGAKYLKYKDDYKYLCHIGKFNT